VEKTSAKSLQLTLFGHIASEMELELEYLPSEIFLLVWILLKVTLDNLQTAVTYSRLVYI